MAQLGLFLWALFFIVLGFSMLPGYMALIMSISFIGGILDGLTRDKRKRRGNRTFRL